MIKKINVKRKKIRNDSFSIQKHKRQSLLYVRGSEKISHMSEILGMDFFAYLDAGELPEHFAF